MDNNVPLSGPKTGSKNSLLTIILILLILITLAMIANHFAIRSRSKELETIPVCVGNDDLELKNRNSKTENFDSSSSKHENSNDVRSTKTVGSYADGSYHPELKRAMIEQARQEALKSQAMEAARKSEEQTAQEQSARQQSAQEQHAQKQSTSKQPIQQPSRPKVRFCIYHMEGCGHCHDIMRTKQTNGMTMFEQLKQIFESRPDIEIVDYQYGRDPQASKYRAFPVIVLIKGESELEYNRQRTVEHMARFIIENAN